MNKEFFINNRKKVFDKLEENSLVILYAGALVTKSEDEEFHYVPNRNFYYVSGVDEPDDVLVLYKGKENREIIFITRFDETKAKWVGRTYNSEEISSKGGLTDIYYLDEMNDILSKFMKVYKVNKVYFDFNGYNDKELNANYLYLSRHFPKLIKKANDIYPVIANLRLIKEDCEIEEIKKAIHLTNIALTEVKKNIKDGQSEKELEALFEYHCLRNGATDLAFNTIAASGIHSCTLHYSTNNDIMHKGDVILFDLGSEVNYYKSDISRTFPVSNKFSPRQQQIYDIVRGAQEVVLKLAKPGVGIQDLQKAVVSYYEVELKKIGLIDKPEDVKKYYYHSVSHPIGLDTHDVAYLSPRNMILQKGWVISNEPGLYIEEEKIGIRIEDDIYITEDGCINLSEEIEK